MDCCVINKVILGINDFDEFLWCKDIGKFCKDIFVEVLWICCVDVDVSIYIVVIVFCIIGVSGYNILVSLSLFYEFLNKK